MHTKKNLIKFLPDCAVFVLSNTKEEVIVDLEQVETLSHFCWYGKTGEWDKYARAMSHGKEIKMHRLIMGVTDLKIHVDHINGNTYDNRKSNLRLADNATNHMNQKGRKDNKSGYKGVSFRDGKWTARIGNGGYYHLGTFKTAEEAAKAYDEKAKELYGEFALLNFPDKKC